jgi:hypothetical protein
MANATKRAHKAAPSANAAADGHKLPHWGSQRLRTERSGKCCRTVLGSIPDGVLDFPPKANPHKHVAQLYAGAQ